MFDNTAAAIAPMGHNNPPSDIDAFGEVVKNKYPAFIAKAEELLAAQERVPKEVNDDETSGKVGDFVKQVQAAIRNLENARKSEKAEYDAAAKRVDGFFKVRYINKLDLLKKSVEALQADYLQRKEDKRRQLEEERAEALRQKAAEELAEAQRKEAEAKKKQEEAEAENQRIAAEAARKQREIEEAAAAKQAELQAQIDKLKADAAEQERTRLDAEEKERLKALEAQQKEVRAEAREDLKELKDETKLQETAVKEISQAAKSDLRESKALLDSAVRTDRTAEKVEKLATGSAASLARTRGEGGSLSTIETRWIGTVTNRDELDLLALRQHFKDDDLQIALNSWVKANPGQQLKGAFIREDKKAVIR